MDPKVPPRIFCTSKFHAVNIVDATVPYSETCLHHFVALLFIMYLRLAAIRPGVTIGSMGTTAWTHPAGFASES